MAEAATVITTGGTSVNKVWRKVQGDVAQGFQFSCEEYGWFEEFPSEGIDWSQRETLIPLDINEEIGIASIPEGGWQARPSSVNMEEISISLIEMNGRFNASNLSMWADQGLTNQVEKQLKYQGAKKVQAMGRSFADKVYGTSVGTIALTDTDVAASTTATLTLKDAYGQTGIDNAAYLADRVRVGEYIALVDGSAIVANGIGVITAITPATPSIAVTFIGSVSVSNNDLKIVGANSMENTTLAGTDYNRGLVGFLDILHSVTVHGLASSSVANWDTAMVDTTGGRFSSKRLLKGDHEIANEGTGKLDTLLLAQGVHRDWIDSEQTLVRHDSPIGMETDASVKSKGRTIRSTRRVPPTYAIGYAKKSFRKVALLPKPTGSNGVNWGDGKEYINQSAMVFNVNLVVGTICNARKNFVAWTGLTEA